MPPLAEIQARLAGAMVTGEALGMLPLLVGGSRAAARLAIHLRHYETSLTAAIAGRFPACGWLLGAAYLARAARDFVRHRPPTIPSIAEYGADFPRFLAGLPGAAPYVTAFAELEWHVGRVSVAIDRPPLAMSALAALPAEALANARLGLQPGLAYLRSPWAVDELMRLYLADSMPDRYVLEAGETHIEALGARGAVRLDRLDAADFIFRQALVAGVPIGIAAERGLDADPAFPAGQALTRLFAAGLVVAVTSEGPPKDLT